MGSTPTVGSSRIMRGGSCNIATAKENLLFCPPLHVCMDVQICVKLREPLTLEYAHAYNKIFEVFSSPFLHKNQFVSDVCLRCLSQMFVSDVCLRCLSQMFVSDVCLRCLSQMFVSDVCIRCLTCKNSTRTFP